MKFYLTNVKGLSTRRGSRCKCCLWSYWFCPIRSGPQR